MSNLKEMNQKLVDMVYMIREVDLEAIRDDLRYREEIQPLFDPTQWIKDADAIDVYSKLVHAAIHFRDETQEIPFKPKK